MQSLNNQSNISLRANAIFIGSWDDILKYQNIQINLNADTNCEILYYTSNDKVLIENQSFLYNANDSYFNSINSTSRYVYFTVRNLEDVDQESFNFTVLYKDSPISSGGLSSDVSITAPLNGDGSVFVGGNLTLSGSIDANITNASLDVAISNYPAIQVIEGSVDANITNTSLDVAISNFPVTQPVSNGSLSSMSFNTNRLNVLDSDANTTLTNIYNVVNSRGGVILQNGDIDADGTTSSLNLSNVNVKNLTIYGNQDSNGNVLTLQFSFDGTNFFKSQYSYSFGSTNSGNFGFNVQCCPKYVRIQSANLCSLTLFVDYC